MLKNIVIVYIVESLLYFMVFYTMFYTSDSEAVLIQKMISPPFKSVLHMIYPTLLMHNKINSFFCGYLLMLKGTYTPYFSEFKVQYNLYNLYLYLFYPLFWCRPSLLRQYLPYPSLQASFLLIGCLLQTVGLHNKWAGIWAVCLYKHVKK